jgi:hypothetical protein
MLRDPVGKSIFAVLDDSKIVSSAALHRTQLTPDSLRSHRNYLEFLPV